MRLLKPQGHGSDEALELGRLPRKVLPHIRDLGHHSFPAFPPGFARLQDLKDLGLGLGLDGGQGHLELARLFFPLLFHHAGNVFGLKKR